MAPYLAKVEISNFGPIQNGVLNLTPLHALIGPNDSGKTTVLRALLTLSNLAFQRPVSAEAQLFRKSWKVSAAASDAPLLGYVAGENVRGILRNSPGPPHRVDVIQGSVDNVPSIASLLRAVEMVRLDPDSMRQATPLITRPGSIRFEDERGKGLGAVLDAIFANQVRNYLALEARLKGAFAAVDSFSLRTTPSGRSVGVRLNDGTEVMPEGMSEGLLYFLAFNALEFLKPTPGVILVEEPENGLHPARIAEVVRILRGLSKTIQVIVATHSPLVINEFDASEVTVVTRDPKNGTQFTPVAQTPNFEQRQKVYALGELWLNYANGTDEAPLLKGTEAK